MRGLLQTLKANAKVLGRFLIPPLCVSCEQEIEAGLLCGDCYDAIEIVNPPICEICGRPLRKRRACIYCKKTNAAFDRARAWALFLPPLDKVMHAFKYNNKPSLAKVLGLSLTRVLESDSLLKSAEFLVPVPLHHGRERDRGYNQAELLCRVIHRETGKGIHKCLLRAKNTPTQTKLEDEERKKNVAGAFKLRKNLP